MDHTRINYYELINVSPNANPDDIKKAFLEKARRLIEAYNVLTDPETRRQYDLSLKFSTQHATPDTSKLPIASQNLPSDPQAAAIELDKIVVAADGRSLIPDTKITQRLLSRIPADRPVFVLCPDKRMREGRLKDISGTGARVALRADLALDATVQIATTPDNTPFVVARVVRIITPRREFGVKWLQLDEKHLPKGLLSDSVF